MPQALTRPLFAVLMFSAVAAWAAVAYDQPRLVTLAAAMAVAGLLHASVLYNRPMWKAGPASRRPEAAAAANALLIATAYAWGGTVMLLAYVATRLHWQHGWEYGCGMWLIALALRACARGLENRTPALVKACTRGWLATLTTLQGLAAVGGLVFLVGSGKLGAGKPDWAANIVFMAGGLALIALSAFAVYTHRVLTRDG
jgi:hypothetical protein